MDDEDNNIRGNLYKKLFHIFQQSYFDENREPTLDGVSEEDFDWLMKEAESHIVGWNGSRLVTECFRYIC